MGSDIYIHRIAHLLVKQHGMNAAAVVAELPDVQFGASVLGVQVKAEIVAAIGMCVSPPDRNGEGLSDWRGDGQT